MEKPIFKTLCLQAQGEIDRKIAEIEARLTLIKNGNSKAAEFFASGMSFRMDEEHYDQGYVKEILRGCDGYMLGGYLEDVRKRKPSKYIEALYNAYLQNPEFAHQMFLEGYEHECDLLGCEDEDSDAPMVDASVAQVAQTDSVASVPRYGKSMHRMLEDALCGMQRDTTQLIEFINSTDYFDVMSSSHDHWKGGMAQHAFRAYSYAMYIFDELKKYGAEDVRLISRDSLTLTTLTHDICNIHSHQFTSGHGSRSRNILEFRRTGAIATMPELNAVECHRHRTDELILKDDEYKEETLQLHRLLYLTDHLAAGTTWNTTRFKEGRKQKNSNKGLYTEAFERSWQCVVPNGWLSNRGIKEGMYLDCHYQLQHIGTSKVGFGIASHFEKDVSNIEKLYPNAGDDIISYAHSLVKEGRNPLLVIGVKLENPRLIDNMTCDSERDFLVCSNVAPVLYKRTGEHSAYTYTMKDEAKAFISDVKNCSGVFLAVNGIEFFRLGNSKYYQMVEPWSCRVVLYVNSTDSYIVEMPQDMSEVDLTPSCTYNRENTPDYITSLKEDEIFVFGSNIQGRHLAGAASCAHKNFGAVWGVGEGLTGQSYALPTMEGGVDYIGGNVKTFLEFAKSHPEKRFLVTPIACGIAGFEAKDIAPLFKDAIALQNVILPKSFVDILE